MVTIRPYTSRLSADMVLTVSRPCRARNISSRNVSGSPRWPPVTRCSSCPDVLGELRGVGAQPPGQCGQQSIRELESLVGLELSAVQSTQHRVHLDHRRRLVDRGIERAMDRDEVALADELVEFDVVDVAPGAGLRRVQHQEQMVVVSMNLGYLIAVRASPESRADGTRRSSSGSARPARSTPVCRPRPARRSGPDRAGRSVGSRNSTPARRNETDVHVGLLAARSTPIPS